MAVYVFRGTYVSLKVVSMSNILNNEFIDLTFIYSIAIDLPSQL